MWIVTRNGRPSAKFKSREKALEHRRKMEAVSMLLKQNRDRWRIERDES